MSEGNFNLIPHERLLVVDHLQALGEAVARLGRNFRIEVVQTIELN